MGRIKDFLKSVRSEQKELSQLQDHIDEIESSLLPQAIRYDKDKVQTSPDDPMIRVMAEVDEYREDMKRMVLSLTVKRRKAFGIIKRLDDSRHRQVLELYFLEPGRPMMWQVGERMGYSERRTYELYTEALNILEDKSPQ